MKQVKVKVKDAFNLIKSKGKHQNFMGSEF